MFSPDDSDMKKLFGLGLPHGLTPDNKLTKQVRKCQERFNQIEGVFRKSKSISKDRLWLWVTQAGFFEQKPRLASW